MPDHWAEYRAEIDRRLSELRPARVGSDERDWREPVYGWARNHIPDESRLVHNYAEQTVNDREGQATKQGNRIVRAFLHGQAPLEWSIVGPYPVRVGKMRIRLDAASLEDIEDAARELEHAGKVTFDEVMLLVAGLRDLVREARRAGYSTIRELGDLAPRTSPEGFLPFSEDDDDDPFGDEDA